MKTRLTVPCSCNKYLNRITPCCDFFKQMLNDCQVRIVYSEKSGRYGIDIISSGAMQGILYCPWCGTKLPEIISDEDDE